MINPSVGYIRSLSFSAGFLVVLILVTPFILLLAVLRIPNHLRYWFMARWGQFCIWWLKLTCGIRQEVFGQENIPDQPVIVFSKHQSTWETLYIPQLTRRHQAWVLKRELIKVPFFGWSMYAVGSIPIVRSSGLRALKKISEVGKKYLSGGSWVIIFPEGTRVAPGEKEPFAIGGAMLAAHAKQYPILPIAHNAGTCWPRKGFIKRHGTITVVIGKPIDVSEMKAKQINQTVESWINDTMTSLENGEYRASAEN